MEFFCLAKQWHMSHVLSVLNGEQMAHNKEMNEQESEKDTPETHRFSSRPECLERVDYKYDTHDKDRHCQRDQNQSSLIS